MVLLDMISKLTLTVKPQSTLRTLKWMACAPDGTFLKCWCLVLLVPVLSHMPPKSFQAWQ